MNIEEYIVNRLQKLENEIKVLESNKDYLKSVIKKFRVILNQIEPSELTDGTKCFNLYVYDSTNKKEYEVIKELLEEFKGDTDVK